MCEWLREGRPVGGQGAPGASRTAASRFPGQGSTLCHRLTQKPVPSAHSPPVCPCTQGPHPTPSHSFFPFIPSRTAGTCLPTPWAAPTCWLPGTGIPALLGGGAHKELVLLEGGAAEGTEQWYVHPDPSNLSWGLFLGPQPHPQGWSWTPLSIPHPRLEQLLRGRVS